MKSRLAELLDREYRLASITPKCRNLLLSFLRENESVLGEDIFFIKCLTKKGGFLLDNEPGSLDGLLDRLFFYNIEGVMMAKDEVKRPGIEESYAINLKQMEAHFHGYAADVAEALFKRTKYIFWGEKHYWHNIDAAEISEKIGMEYGKYKDLLNSSFYYARAAKAAYALYLALHPITGNLDLLTGLLTKSCDNWLKSAEIAYEINPRGAAYAFLNAGIASEKRFKLTGKPNHMKEAYQCFRKSAGTFALVAAGRGDTEKDIVQCISMYSFAVTCANYMHNKLQSAKDKKYWAGQMQECCLIFLELSDSYPDATEKLRNFEETKRVITIQLEVSERYLSKFELPPTRKS